MLRLITGHTHVSAGSIEVFGENPYENDPSSSGSAWWGSVRRTPSSSGSATCSRPAGSPFPTGTTNLPRRCPTPSASLRNVRSGGFPAVCAPGGITLGIASRAPLTLLDEPNLGLDAVARRTFYDHLLADFASHPRTVVLSTHLIDEVSDLLQRVVLIDDGKVLLDEDADDLRGSAVLVSGATPVVEAFAAAHDAVRMHTVASFTRATLRGVDPRSRDLARGRGLTVEPVTLQDLVVDLTMQKEMAR